MANLNMTKVNVVDNGKSPYFSLNSIKSLIKRTVKNEVPGNTAQVLQWKIINTGVTSTNW